VRSVTADDAEALVALGERVSDRTLYLRFFSLSRDSADRYLRSLARDGDRDHVAVVAELGGDVVAVAGWDRVSEHEAEIALLVEDAHQQQGLGTLLLEDLTNRAHAVGITSFAADTLVENHLMLDVFGASGLTEDRRLRQGVVRTRLSTDLDEEAMARVDERESRAEQASLGALLAPRSVAVVGAGRDPSGVGHQVLQSIVANGFSGAVHVVNPHAFEVAGHPSHARIGEVPDQVDLAVVAVPVDQVVGVLDECGAAGVRVAVVLTSGLGEVGEDGVRRQREALETARRHDMRLIGPNCLGVVNTDPEVRLHAWFGRAALQQGPLAVATQSGAVGISLAEYAGRCGLGVAALVSLGNKADVSGNDLLLLWWHDPRVRVIALYLESLGNPRKFARLARRVGRATPVLVVKGGRSAGGRRAGRSHTAAAYTPDDAVDALFALAGVIRLDTVEQMVDVARLLAAQPVPDGGRVGVVSNGGGAGVLAADAAEWSNLQVPALSMTLRERLEAGAAENPVDLGAEASPETLRAALEALAASGEVDSLLVSLTATRTNDVEAMLAAVSSADLGELPVVVNVLGADQPCLGVPLARGSTAPVYEFPESAVHALGHVVGYGRWRRTPRGALTRPEGIHTDAARELVNASMADADAADGWVSAEAQRRLLEMYGIGVVPVETCASRDEAVAAAERLGFPVVLKTAVPGIVHKSDVGGVRLALPDAEAVTTAYDDVTGRLGEGVLVQPMAGAGVEIVVGVTREETFGPVGMVGLGGVYTDLLGDRAFGLLPLSDLEAASLVRSLRAAPLLLGYRGSAPLDVGALEDLLLRVSALAADVPELAELDLNPVVVQEQGVVVVDAKMRLAPPVAVPDEHVRRLRS
jgi:acyl-CoA synthetase (NDP forming)/GNAT superfamily N-acetyltransferase